ncbi:MAG: PaaI family thioesterase [Candidatus Omnitrophota bacterium]
MPGLILEDDKMCFACGTRNSAGLKLQFILEGKTLKTKFRFLKIHQGFKDIVHGGLIGLVLDEVMVNLLWKLNIRAISAEFNVRLRKPCPVEKDLEFTGWIEKEDKRIIYTRSSVQDAEGVIYADAQAKCVRVEKKND